jgi:hypothetical protein
LSEPPVVDDDPPEVVVPVEGVDEESFFSEDEPLLSEDPLSLPESLPPDDLRA